MTREEACACRVACRQILLVPLDVSGALFFVMRLGIVIHTGGSELGGLSATILKDCFVFVGAVIGGIHRYEFHFYYVAAIKICLEDILA
jgi:hypothetical protein